MELIPQNSDGKFVLLDENGKEVKFDYIVDAREALEGIPGTESGSKYTVPSGPGYKITKYRPVNPQEAKRKPGRPPRTVQVPILTKVPEQETDVGGDEGSEE